MRLVADIAIPAGATLDDVEQMMDTLSGVGYTELHMKARILRLEFDSEERGDIPPIVRAVARNEAGAAIADEELLLAVAGAVLGVMEQWAEVDRKLRSCGWTVPVPQSAADAGQVVA